MAHGLLATYRVADFQRHYKEVSRVLLLLCAQDTAALLPYNYYD